MQAPGRMFLLVTGTMYTIVGGFYLLNGLMIETAGQMLGQIFGTGAGIGVYSFILLVISGFYITIGLMGIVNRDNLKEAGTLKILGIICIILDVVSMFAFDTFSASTVLLLAIPVCYTIGAHTNKVQGGY